LSFLVLCKDAPDTITVLERIIDRKLAKMLLDELPKLLEKRDINSSAYNLLKKDLEILLTN